MDLENTFIWGLTLPQFSILCATAVISVTWLLLRGRFLGKRQVYEIVELRVYPVKSCRGISLRKTDVKMHGLDLDRRWMFIDAETHDFITIRQNSRMTLINTAFSNDGKKLILSVGEGDERKEVSIDANPSQAWLAQNLELVPVKIWGMELDGYMYGPEVNEVFSRFLDQEVRLVHKGPTDRILGSNAKPELLGRKQATYFPDMMPILIASKSSIAELNSRLVAKGENAITIERFRPNIIIQGNKAWSEDSWRKVQIAPSPSSNAGSVKPLVMDVVARCARCQVPNVEPSTAEKAKREPWDTLMSYRRIDEGSKYKPCFGMLSVSRSEAPIEVGMQLEVLEETSEHLIVH